jgi:hypothetical protein
MIGIEAAKAGDTRLHEACQSIEPPCSHRLGNLGLLQPGVSDVEAMRRPPRGGQRATTARGEPIMLATANRGIDGNLVDGQIKPDAQAMLGRLLRHACDAGIGGARPAQRRVQNLMISGDEDVAAGTGQKRWRDAHRVEAHGLAQRKVRRPVGEIAGNQRMQVINLWCHAVRGSVCLGGSRSRLLNASE